MFPGGLTAASRHAGAEPIVTERSGPYDESTLRRSAQKLEETDGAKVVLRLIHEQVANAVNASDVKATAHTDMYDQVYWTKKFAHAAPIGGLGNRLLAATYFGMTFVRVGGESDHGPLLAYHVSWHKPASPLGDGIKDLHADATRHTWLTANIRRHTWDRGGNGVELLRWAAGQSIPYLTVSNGWVYLSSQGQPTLHTAEELPVFVRRDVRLARSSSAIENAPRIVVAPSRPDKGAACKRGIRFPTNAKLTDAELTTMNDTYKQRWPDMENQIKALVAVGFGANRDRALEKMTSRGVDGAIARSVAREAQLQGEIEALQGPIDTKTYKRAMRTAKKVVAERAKRADIEQQPVTKSARVAGHGELFCKTLMLLMFNALAMLLAKSPLPVVRAMTPARVRDLLLAQPALASITANRITLWIEPVADAAQKPLQVELVRLLNKHGRLRLKRLAAFDLRLLERREKKRR